MQPLKKTNTHYSILNSVVPEIRIIICLYVRDLNVSTVPELIMSTNISCPYFQYYAIINRRLLFEILYFNVILRVKYLL
jgi:hypothetical protein